MRGSNLTFLMPIIFLTHKNTLVMYWAAHNMISAGVFAVVLALMQSGLIRLQYFHV